MHYSFADEKELILFSDESITKGNFYSNFYGGALVGATQYIRINNALNKLKQELNIFDEIKWSKVTPNRLSSYCLIMDSFFNEIVNQKIKIRIMCRQNAHKPTDLTDEQKENQYFLLYYQFIKNAFGLDKLGEGKTKNLRFFFDQFPDKIEKVYKFKEHIKRLEKGKFKNSKIRIQMDNIAEAKSHNHIILQCLDVVLGAMAFRMNDQHLRKNQNGKRGKRTIAKEKLYKHIRKHICKIKPNFNIGASTAVTKEYPDRADLPYAHWIFKPYNSEYEPSFTKKHYRKN